MFHHLLLSTYSHLFHCFIFSIYFSYLYLFPSVSLFSNSIYFSGLYFFLVTSLFSCSSHLLPLLIPYILLFTLLVWSTYNWLQLCPHVPCPPLVYLFPSVSLFSFPVLFMVTTYSHSFYFLINKLFSLLSFAPVFFFFFLFFFLIFK